ncbi:MAG: primosomal protein N' [Erysipelotrichaceae bacterium]|nr:primosomal protein N' [Erysipelotrichaceae bacterium]
MKIVDVLIERKIQSLNRPFSYVVKDDALIEVGERVLVPFNNKNIVGYVINVTKSDKSIAELEKEFGYKLFEVRKIIDEKPLLTPELILLANEIKNYYLAPYISILQAMLPLSLKPTSSSLKGPKIAYEYFVKIVSDNEDNLTPKQIELLRLVKNNGEVNKKDIKSPSILKKLIDNNHLQIIKKEKKRLVINATKEQKNFVLTNEQNQAIESVLHSKQNVTLLQGITGCGKTEIYLSLAEKVIETGKNVLILVPEISLTPIMVNNVYSRFNEKVAILHSGLTNAERYDEYRKILNKEVNVVVGTRSAIFAPLDNIGLIIIDEEHSESYKQDNLPYYHAREVAIMRSKINNAKVLLGSATPSFESKTKAMKGIYNFIKIDKRINKLKLPETLIVDMSKSMNLSRDSYLFSKPLISAINEALARKEQIILLLNRRGYSTYVSCRKCGHIFKCPNCDIALTYHKNDKMLKCHHCGHVELMSEYCPECGSNYIAYTGFGSEKIVSEVNRLFPSARVLRLDSDVSEVRGNIKKAIASFSNYEADILVGTQMIAKGHDFPRVTLVGIVLADVGLSLPSFRSSERVFQLITQAIGRSGRSDLSGKAIIQTYLPNHYSILLASKQNYDAFFNYEMRIRHIQQYPPFSFLLSIEVSAKNEEYVILAANDIVNNLNSKLQDEATILGPVAPYFAYQNNTYKRLILIKYKNSDKIKQEINKLLETFKFNNVVNVKINVDPYDF